MKNFLHRNWKNILLMLFILLWFSKCTQSCNRKQEIRKNNIEIAYKDSIILNRDSIIHDMQKDAYYLNQNLDAEKKHNDNFTSIASENQSALNSKIRELNKEISNLKRENESLKKQLEEKTNL